MWPQAPAWGPGRSRFTSCVGAKDGSEESFAPHGAIPSIATHTPRWRVGPHSVAATRLYSDALRAISWTALIDDRRRSASAFEAEDIMINSKHKYIFHLCSFYLSPLAFSIFRTPESARRYRCTKSSRSI